MIKKIIMLQCSKYLINFSKSYQATLTAFQGGHIACHLSLQLILMITDIEMNNYYEMKLLT